MDLARSDGFMGLRGTILGGESTLGGYSWCAPAVHYLESWIWQLFNVCRSSSNKVGPRSGEIWSLGWFPLPSPSGTKYEAFAIMLGITVYLLIFRSS